jgi:hypothetical protein
MGYAFLSFQKFKKLIFRTHLNLFNMKKKYFFIPEAGKWNTLVRRFINLHKRIKKGSASTLQIMQMNYKLHKIYRRLEKMQYKVGIKLAGSALALMLFSSPGFSQSLPGFTSKGYLRLEEAAIDKYYMYHTFADVDNDSDLDLYISNNQSGFIYSFINEGGEFTATGERLQADGADIELGSMVPAFADLDNDGDLDLYTGYLDTEGHVRVYLNDGSGNFSDASNLQADGTDIGIYGGPNGVVFADVDDDSDLDLYIGGQYTINVFINDGNGNFSAAGELKKADGTVISYEAPRPYFADLDEDNDLDLYLGKKDGYIDVFINNGGSFSHIGKLQADGTDIYHGNVTSGPVLADIDGDNDLDLYTANDRNIHVYKNNGSGDLTYEGLLMAKNVIYTSKYGGYSPSFADIDNDGDLDLYVGKDDANIEVLQNDGSGLLTQIADLQADGVDIDKGTVPTFADVDGDNDLDLYAGYGGKIRVYTNTSGAFSDAGFMKSQGIDINTTVNMAPYFADIDQDNDLDLYFGAESGRIQIYLNNSGNFIPSGFMQADGSLISVSDNRPVFADLDEDSDLDLFVGGNGYIYAFINDGSGSYSAFSSAGKLQASGIDIELPSAHIAFADLDDDGDLDLYVGSGNYIHVFESDGIVSIPDNQKTSDNLSVYPNPATNLVYFTGFEKEANISVMDITGKTIMTYTNIQPNDCIDFSVITAGVYIIKIQLGDKTLTKKLVVE